MNDITSADNALRDQLERLLASGLETEWEQRAYDNVTVDSVVTRLRAAEPDDYVAKLSLAGFTDQPYKGESEDISQACETCMYYVVNRRYCELSALRLPVKPEWSCRLWRI